MSNTDGSHPSMKRDLPLQTSAPEQGRYTRILRRVPIYAGLVIAGLVIAAYIDGGEEPLHPIVQEIAIPKAGTEA